MRRARSSTTETTMSSAVPPKVSDCMPVICCIAMGSTAMIPKKSAPTKEMRVECNRSVKVGKEEHKYKIECAVKQEVLEATQYRVGDGGQQSVFRRGKKACKHLRYQKEREREYDRYNARLVEPERQVCR